MKKNRILIVGCNGVVGVELVPRLAEKYELMLWDNGPCVFEGFPFRKVDITNADEVRQSMEPVDAVIHLAIASAREILYKTSDGLPTPASQKAFDEQTLRVNNDGTFHVMSASHALGIPKFVYMSSLTAISVGEETESIAVDQSPIPKNLYACTKLFGENLGRLFSQDGKMEVRCFRLGVPHPTKLTREGKGYKDERRRTLYTHHDDIARAMVCAIESKGIAFGLYNLLSAQAAVKFPQADLTAVEIGFTPESWIQADGSLRL